MTYFPPAHHAAAALTAHLRAEEAAEAAAELDADLYDPWAEEAAATSAARWPA